MERWEAEGLVKNKSIIKAFLNVPRENFISEHHMSQAYSDHPLPLIKGQTISQPTTIIIMLEALNLKEGHKVLEIGAGSGYNGALISHIVGKKGKVYAVEIIPELAGLAENNIKKLKNYYKEHKTKADFLKNLRIINSDGSLGWKKAAPYDRIIVTAACPSIPKPLVEQLREGGIIIAPVDDILYGQKMIKGIKTKGTLVKDSLGYFSFVPLKGKHGYG